MTQHLKNFSAKTQGLRFIPSSRHTSSRWSSEASQVSPETFGLIERPHTDEVSLERLPWFSVPGTGQELPGWTDAIKVAQGCLGTSTKGGHDTASPQSGGNGTDLRCTSP